MIRRQPWGQLRGQFGRFAAERGFLDDAPIHGQLARFACKRTFGNGAGEACSAWPPEVWHSKTGLRNDHFGKILNHEAPIPLHFNFAKDVFAAHAMDVATGDSDALVHVAKDGTETRLSFHDLLEWSQKIARFLKEDCGFQPMNRVIVILPRIPEWWALNLAAIQCGVLLIPGTVQLTSSDIAKRLLTAEAHGVICSQETLARVQEALEKRSPAPVHRLRATIIAASSSATTDPTPLVPPGWKVLPGLQDKDLDPLTGYFPSRSGDPCNLFFTSGTTGLPKLTLVNHVSYGMGHWGTGRLWLNSGSEDLVWNLSDTGWAKAAYSSFYSPWIACATVFSAEMPQFNGTEILDLLEKHPISVICCPPTAMRTIVQDPSLSARKFRNLRLCVSGGEPLNPEVIHVWESSTGIPLMEGYGQTESTISAGSLPGLPRKPSSMGKGMIGYKMVVVDEFGNRLPPNQEGILALDLRKNRPIGLFTKYWKNDEATEKVLKKDHYLTGDRGYIDEDGFAFFISRADDVIISSGYRIGPFEVESALLEHEAVAESAVVASPDPIRGEIVKAFVVLSESYLDVAHDPKQTAELIKDIQTHVKTVTAPYKYPRKVEFVSSLPKTISGKIRRIDLRDHEFGKRPIS